MCNSCDNGRLAWLVSLKIALDVAKQYAAALAQEDFGYTEPRHLNNVKEKTLRKAGVSVAKHRDDILAAIKSKLLFWCCCLDDGRGGGGGGGVVVVVLVE